MANCYGAEQSLHSVEVLATLGQLVELIPVLTPGAEVGEAYGRLRAYLERLGAPIPSS